MTLPMNLSAVLCGVLLCGFAGGACAQWKPVSDVDLTVKPGSALDFSSLVEAGPAGRNGWATVLPDGRIGFESRARPQRFLAASIVFNGLNGGVPDKQGADRLVRELVATGYNLVRFHYIDAYLMTGRKNDFDFDPEKLDRLHYLMATLKGAGIYWMVDGMTSDNGSWGDVEPHRWVKKYRTKLDALVTDEGRRHWNVLVEKLWGRVNPYTGMSTLKDPALVGIILVNEGSIAYMATVDGNRYSPRLAPPFRNWLKERYGDDARWKSAWKGQVGEGESVERIVEVPSSIRGRSPRDIDFARFVADVERSAYGAMDAHVRALGFRGLTTSFDNWGFLGADVSRASTQWVDMHSYQTTPSSFADPGSRIGQTSLTSNAGRYIRELTNARQWGKPFTVSEYGQPFWNRWRHESAALIPAVAAHQGWDAICQFAETPIQFDYRESPFKRRRAIYPYGVGADPIARASERLAALLYLRGDVSEARGKVRLKMNGDQVLARSGGWEQLPESLSRLAFVSAVGLDTGDATRKSASASPDVVVDLDEDASGLKGKLSNALARNGLVMDGSALDALRSSGQVQRANRTRLNDGVFESDTGEIVFDGSLPRISIATPRSALLVMRKGDASAGSLSVRAASAPALFAVSSLDGQAVAQSRRLLVWVLTDAINTGMQFEDAERTTLKSIGSFPPLLETVSATLRVADATGSERVQVWPLSLSGQRRGALQTRTADGRTEFQIDTAALPEGPSVFFEIERR